MTFYIHKQTLRYTGKPYCGQTSEGKVAEYNTIEEARAAVLKFQKKNAIGWNIFDSETGKLLEGFDFYN